jgi:twitching motility protein PilJ
MSVVDTLKNLFAKKSREVDPSVTQELSLGLADGGTATIEAGSTQGTDRHAPEREVDDSIDPAVEASDAERIALPLLGRRSTVTHQRTLFALLAVSLAVLGTVALIAVNQADRVAQQVAGTGASRLQ